jgi:hypothetical protein
LFVSSEPFVSNKSNKNLRCCSAVACPAAACDDFTKWCLKLEASHVVSVSYISKSKKQSKEVPIHVMVALGGEEI